MDQDPRIRPATNIRELPNSFLPGYPLKQGRDDDLYVPIYTDEIDALRDSILYDNIGKQTLFISGQTGSGKTTALHFLPDDEIRAEYRVVFLNAKDLFDLNDVSIIEILLMICYALMEEDEGTVLKDEFLAEIRELENIQKGTLSKETIKEKGGEGSIGGGISAKLGDTPLGSFLGLFKLSSHFFANLKMDAKYRQITREAFILNKRDLVQITNRVVHRFKDRVAKDKQLLLIINELDHLKNPDLIKSIFVTDREALKDIECKKVISVPVNLIGDNFGEAISFFGIKLMANPLKVKLGDSQILEEHRERLTRLALNRVAPDTDLIAEEAIEEAIKYSGGILRQYISILHEAAKKVRRNKGEKVHAFSIEDGTDSLRHMLERSIVISKEKIDILDEVRRQNQSKDSDNEAFIDCLLSNQILFYMNNPSWYSLNPLIEETVRIYAERGSS